MDGAEYNQTGQEFEEILIKLRDLEEKQRLTKDRLLLISQNLLEIKEKSMQDILGIKKDLQIMKQNMNRLMNFIETASSEFSKFANAKSRISGTRYNLTTSTTRSYT